MNAKWYGSALLPDAPEADKFRARKMEFASFLVVDDFGYEREGRTAFGCDQMAEMLVQRIDNMYPTILTTNMKLDGLANRYGTRLSSKLHEAGAFAELEDQVDMRKGEGLN